MKIDMDVTRLLSSRMCHDLVGPAGAVHNGIELVEEMGGDDAGDALKMVAASVDQMSARLGFFRMAFGQGGLTGRKPPVVESHDLITNYLKGGRVNLEWPLDDKLVMTLDVPSTVLKLLFNVVLVAIDTLPRGGIIGISLARMSADQGETGVGLAVKASGDGARMKDDLMLAISTEASEAGNVDLTPHNVHGFFCQQLARELGSEVEVSSIENEVKFAAFVS